MAKYDPEENTANRRSPPFQRTEQAMMASVNEAIEKALRAAHAENPDIATRLPPHYFQHTVLQLLFLQTCGANLETSSGGDPDVARRVLYVGRRIASQWDDRGLGFLHEQDHRERGQLASGAERAALRIVLQVLVEHASASDPDLRSKISATTDAYLTELAPQSAMDKQFAGLTHDFISAFAGPAAVEGRR